jgi:acetylornithine deacetylase/succinyl-diaminopimelate desuccinylase-like protein
MDIKSIDNYLDQNLEASIAELSELIAMPSISAQGTGLEECAQKVGDMLQQRGFQVEIMATEGAPVVFAERRGLSDKTLLIYNHYDVQPPEPLDLWDSPPFEATVKEGILYGRGAADDKGPLVSRFYAIDAFLDNEGELPCNIKFLIEGEEETSSIHLHDFIDKNKEKLSGDACIWEFGTVDHREIPIQHLGLRGICYVELSAETAAVDTHSGIGGSIFPNAAWRLVWALNSLKGPDGKIKIPGFYDSVKPPSKRDLELIEALPEIAEDYKNRYGVKYFLNGLTGGPLLREQAIFQPTCTICGLTSGYQGPGSKTVLPARASAKVDFRLVPDQHPEQVLEQLRNHLNNNGYNDIEISYLGGEPAARTDPDDPFVQMVVDTAEPVYGNPMQITPMMGGSGPNYPFVHILNLPVATAGPGYPGSKTHAPNENLRLDLYIKHAKHIARIMKAFPELP